jgi:pyruvate formate lyase activating enzyme
MIKAAVHSIESFGSVDGPGIRFVIFLKGCNMRCRYCHNPDTWKMTTDDMRSADELLAQATRFRSYWGKKGGITVSGGEALLQMDFLIELFCKAKAMGINTALDTSAQPFGRVEPFFSKFKQLMQYTDIVLLDIKHIDNDEHKLLTGHGNANILDCARYLSEISKPVWIRHVLLPGVTDKESDLLRLHDFLSTLDNIQKVEVLPYHTLGVYKWKQLGIKYTLKGVEPPSAESIKRAEQILNAE